MAKPIIKLKKKTEFKTAPVLTNFSVVKEDKPFLKEEKMLVPVSRKKQVVYRNKTVKYREQVKNVVIIRSFLVKIPNFDALVEFTGEVSEKFDEPIQYVRLFLINPEVLASKNPKDSKAKVARVNKRIISIPVDTIAEGKDEIVKYLENLNSMSKSPGSDNITNFSNWEILPNIAYTFLNTQEEDELVLGDRCRYKLFRTTPIITGDCFIKTVKLLNLPEFNGVPTIDNVKNYFEEQNVNIYKPYIGHLSKIKKIGFKEQQKLQSKEVILLEGRKKMTRKAKVVPSSWFLPDYDENKVNVLINTCKVPFETEDNKEETFEQYEKRLEEAETKGYHVEPIQKFDCVYFLGSYWGWSEDDDCYVNLSTSYASDKEEQKIERKAVIEEPHRVQKNRYIFYDIEAVVDIEAFNPFVPYSIAYLVCDEDDLMKLEQDDKEKDAKYIKSRYNFGFHWGHDCVYQFLKKVEHMETHSGREHYHYKLVSFNGSNFDNFFLINELAKKEKFEDFDPKSVFYFNGSVLNFTFFDKIDTYDLSRHLVGSLRSCCNSFKVKACSKTDLDHYDAQCKFERGELLNDLTYKNQVMDYNYMDVASLAVLFQKYKQTIESISFFPYVEDTETIKFMESTGHEDNIDERLRPQRMTYQGINFWEKKTAGSLMYAVIQKHWELKAIDIPQFTFEVKKIPIFKNEERVVLEALKYLKQFGIEIKKIPKMVDELEIEFEKYRKYDNVVRFTRKTETTKAGKDQLYLFVEIDYRKFYHDLLKYKSAGRCDLSENVPTAILGNFFKFDAKSMYPYCMIIGDYQFPTGKIIPSDYNESSNLLGFFYCDIDQRNLPRNKRIQAEKIWDQRGNLIENCWYSDNILKNYLIPTERIKFLEANGCTVTKKSGFYFTETIQNIDLFEPLVELMKIKNAQDGLKGKEGYNSALRETAKLLSNAVSGKVIEQLHLKTTEYIKMSDYRDKKISDKFTIIDQLDDQHLMISYEKDEDKVFSRQQRPVFYGVLIYTYAQQYLYDTLYKNYDVIYADTDAGSVSDKDGRHWIKNVGMKQTIPHNKRIEEIEPRYKTAKLYNSGLYGCWENENEGLDIVGAFWSKKKEYMIICEDVKKSIIKTKGMMIRYNDDRKIAENSVYLTADDLKRIEKMNNSELLHFYENNKRKVNDWVEIFKDLVVKNKSVKFLCGQFSRVTNNLKKVTELNETEKFNEKVNHIVYRNVVKEIKPRDAKQECRIIYQQHKEGSDLYNRLMN